MSAPRDEKLSGIPDTRSADDHADHAPGAGCRRQGPGGHPRGRRAPGPGGPPGPGAGGDHRPAAGAPPFDRLPAARGPRGHRAGCPPS
ncbi:MAG TPA: hypothetical protein VMW94_00895 [Actinomycetes bacterium]|nr:hypothetical protein [Actinomycetes bacterium]